MTTGAGGRSTGDPRVRDRLGADDELFALVERERRRRSTTLGLIASETPATPEVLRAMGSDLDAKYAEGYPGARHHGGCEVVDEIEDLAISRARALFGAEYVNVAPSTGSTASAAVYAAFAQPDDPVLSLRLAHGGHHSHGSRANFSGRWFTPRHYALRAADERIDYDEIRDMALLHRPRILVAGAVSYSRHLDFAILRAIADEVDCILWIDAAHIAGLAAGGVGPTPVPYADVVTVSTHKVFRGPRGGVVLARERHRKVLSKAVYPFVQGGASISSIAAKAVCFGQSRTPSYRDYVQAVVGNARTLCEELAARGHRVVTGGTDNHMAVLDVGGAGLTGIEAQRRLAEVGIVVDKAVLPFDDRPVAEGSAVRLGTAAATIAGLQVADMADVARWIDTALRADPATAAGVAAEVRDRLAAVA